jgi:hypothetical protein
MALRTFQWSRLLLIYMSDPGEVDPETVIVVLKWRGVSVCKCTADQTGEGYTLCKGDRIEVQQFKPRVSGQTLHYLQCHYHVPIHFFHHPEMMGKSAVIAPSPPEIVH